MSKLLTDQELREELDHAITHETMHISSFEPRMENVIVNRERLIEALLPLIQSQKLAHGEMVIGTDEHYEKSDPRYELSGEPFEWAERNTLRAEQRERNR